ncbi:MAG: sulfite exporter TauE/SafE family protein [Betaproteobacteria bacterium]|nr:sulfite exporter TauE/SafE family protein [Betaproteobacteria bacterium]
MLPPDMTADWAWLTAALLTGLMSSGHCLGMCALPMSALLMQGSPGSNVTRVPAAIGRGGQAAASVANPGSAFPIRLVAYNLGRIGSYTLAGALAGWLGMTLGSRWLIAGISPLRLCLFILANLMIILTGLYLAGWGQGLAPLERLGRRGWRHLAPLAGRFMPARTPMQATLLGALWGWIPCGLVYAMLVTAMARASALQGALSLAAFGMGTLPMMLGVGALSDRLSHRLRDKLRQPTWRRVTAVLVITLGLWGLARSPSISAHHDWAALGALCQSWLP